ncbi:MAG: SDR family oxidoreductase [Calditrichaceae bacterium]
MKKILVTGSNRGIGIEFVRQFLARGDYVFAGCRNPDSAIELRRLNDAYPDRLMIFKLDLERTDLFDDVENDISKLTGRLDILINNAGIYIKNEDLDNLDESKMMTAFRINSIAPILFSRSFINLLKKGRDPKIINISSQMGSLQNKSTGGDYSYCSSKAALNMLTRSLAYDIRQLGIIAVTVHPGWVRTDMGGSNAMIDPSDSVYDMIKLIDRLELNDSSKFFMRDGKIHPW